MDLVLQFILYYGQLAYRAWSAIASIAPLVIWPPGWELPILDHCSGFGAKDRLVRHLATSTPLAVGSGAPVHRLGRVKPNARGRDARCVNQEARWEATAAYHV